ncbi:MAG: hypothetical protein WDZ35_05995 [Crocinitomicaceae bacterium]
MKNLLRNSFLGFLVISAMVGCRKDTPVVEEANETDSTTVVNNCQDLPPESGIGYQYEKNGPQYLAPCFNPNNSNEFVYLRTGTASVAELVKYDLLSNTETVLCNSINIISKPDWGRTGWIIFTTADFHVWKIFEDGSGLQQVTLEQAQKPIFDFEGERFLVMSHEVQLSNDFRPIYDLFGNLVDSVKYVFNNIYTGYPYYSLNSSFNTCFQFYSDHDYPGNSRIGICKIQEDSLIQELNSFIYDGDIGSLVCANNAIYYSEYWGSIYKIDLNTLITSIFKEGCQTQSDYVLSLSPDGNKMLVERMFFTLGENMIVDEQHEIWLIDLTDPGKEEKILGE